MAVYVVCRPGASVAWSMGVSTLASVLLYSLQVGVGVGVGVGQGRTGGGSSGLQGSTLATRQLHAADSAA